MHEDIGKYRKEGTSLSQRIFLQLIFSPSLYVTQMLYFNAAVRSVALSPLDGIVGIIVSSFASLYPTYLLLVWSKRVLAVGSFLKCASNCSQA
jgi:hypothetical protein